MMHEADTVEFAREWIAAWNAHDLDAVLFHYNRDVVLTSPVAVRILGDPSGTVKGLPALRNYFQRGLNLYPNLRFELLDTLCGLSSIVLYYRNQNGTKTAEFMELGDDGFITRVIANYSV